MPLTDRAQAQHEPAPARFEAGLVGMHDGRRVEQRRRLHRVLVGEPGADEAAALVGQLGVVGYAVRDPLVVRQQHAGQVAVPAPVAITHAPQGRADLVLGQREDPRQDPGRPGTTVVRELVTGNEQPGQHPRRVGLQDDIGPRDALLHPTPPDRAVFNGHRRPWTGPAAASKAGPVWTPRPGSRCARSPSRPSKPPPLTGSYMGVPESLTPRNHIAARSIPSAQRCRPAIRYARRAGVGQRGHLDRLLVETRPGLPRPPTRRRHHGQLPVPGLPVEQPAQQAETVRDQCGRVQRGARREQGLGQHRVGVAQPGLRPPPRLVEGGPADRDRRGGDQRARLGVVRQHREDLRRAERGERHRPPMR